VKKILKIIKKLIIFVLFVLEKIKINYLDLIINYSDKIKLKM